MKIRGFYHLTRLENRDDDGLCRFYLNLELIMGASTSLNYKTIFEEISQPLLVADSDKKILFLNKGALKLLELTPSDIQNLYFHEVFQLPETDSKNIESVLLNGKIHHGTTLVKNGDNEFFQIRFSVKGISLPTNTRLGYFIEIEKADRVELTDADIKKMGHKTSKIAHDISNPLAVLRIHCDNFALKAQKTRTFSSDEVLERILKLSNATDRLTSSNDELKKLSKALSSEDMDAILNFISNDESQNQFSH